MTIKRFARGLAFFMIGLLLFLVLQYVLSYKWRYPFDWSERHEAFEEFYDIAKDSDIQVLFLGSSHAYNGIDPMAIYRETGITSFNLATASQPVEASKYILEDVLSRTHLSHVFLDASLFFREVDLESLYRWVIDNLKPGRTKIRFAKDYAQRFGATHETGTFLSVFLPIYEYHERWKELQREDFSVEPGRNLYEKGYYGLAADITPAALDVATMNYNDEQSQTRMVWANSFEDGEKLEKVTEEPVSANYEVLEENLNQLLQLKELCDVADVSLCIFKVPALGYPQYYTGSWTMAKSLKVKALSEKYDIPFLDLMYDVDLGLDWATDTVDGGNHLNVEGAKKVSAFFAAYLRDECGLKGLVNQHFEEDLPIYEDVNLYVELLSTREMGAYMKALLALDNTCVFIASKDDMCTGLNTQDIVQLRRLGLKTNFKTLELGDAYLAVIDRGRVVYEASSDAQIEKEGVLEDGLEYRLLSGGWYSGADSSIELNGTEYSLNVRGINIVVYDRESRTVVDSLCFDTWESGEHLAIRGVAEENLRNYSNWRARQDYLQGIR